MADLIDIAGAPGQVALCMDGSERNLLAVLLKPTMTSSALADHLHSVVVGNGPACRTCEAAGLAVAVEADHCSECAAHLSTQLHGGLCTRCDRAAAAELEAEQTATS